MNFGKVHHFLDNKTFYIPRKLYCRYCKTFYLHSKKVPLCTVLWIQWNLLSTFQERSIAFTVKPSIYIPRKPHSMYCILDAESWNLLSTFQENSIASTVKSSIYIPRKLHSMYCMFAECWVMSWLIILIIVNNDWYWFVQDWLLMIPSVVSKLNVYCRPQESIRSNISCLIFTAVDIPIVVSKCRTWRIYLLVNARQW